MCVVSDALHQAGREQLEVLTGSAATGQVQVDGGGISDDLV
jgi:hypothetical protein